MRWSASRGDVSVSRLFLVLRAAYVLGSNCVHGGGHLVILDERIPGLSGRSRGFNPRGRLDY